MSDDKGSNVPLRPATQTLEIVKLLEGMYPDDCQNAITAGMMAVLYLSVKYKTKVSPSGAATFFSQTYDPRYIDSVNTQAAVEASSTDEELAERHKKQYAEYLKNKKEKDSTIDDLRVVLKAAAEKATRQINEKRAAQGLGPLEDDEAEEHVLH